MEFTIRDTRGVPVVGAPIDVAGPIKTRLITAEGGVARGVVTSGRYAVSVEGCSETIEITSPSRGSADVAIDQVVRAGLTVEWRHRFAPANGEYPSEWAPADGSPVPNTQRASWKPGTAYRLSYPVIDRCANSAKAPNVSVASWTVTASSNVTIVDAGSRRSDALGIASFVAQCSGSGPVRISIADSDNPDDPAIDLIARSSNSAFGRPSCGSA
jgi:hypothetical protein